MIEIRFNGEVIRKSRNLRGLIAHARRVGVRSAAVHRTEGGGSVYVAYSDGSECRTSFADFTIARDFLRKRWARWGLYAEVRNSDDYWSFLPAPRSMHRLTGAT